MRAAVGIGDDACRYYIQGILWIDQSAFEIVRLQTDLIAPLTGVHLDRLRSDLRFSEVKIPTRNLTLWMPSDVKISWQGKDSAGMEIHRYSNYRLFAATSRIILPTPNNALPLLVLLNQPQPIGCPSIAVPSRWVGCKNLRPRTCVCRVPIACPELVEWVSPPRHGRSATKPGAPFMRLHRMIGYRATRDSSLTA